MTQFGVSYFGNRFTSHAVSDIKRIADSCNYIVHTVSESDLSYHKAVLTKIFKESRKAGLEVWADPWGFGGVFGGESLSRFLLDHRDCWQMMSDGRIVPVACLNRSEWRSYMMEWILNVRDMGTQVVFWDEPHISFDFDSEWEGVYSCVCSLCQDLFKKQYGSSLPATLNDAARQFRLETIRGFLSELMAYAHSKGLKNALCLYAFKGNEEYENVWKEAASLKNLDILGCDPYWRWHLKHDPATHVKEFSRILLDHAQPHQKSSQIWIQAMRFPSGTEPEIPKAIEAAVKEGVTHIAAWSFDGGELLDAVLSERPQDVWQMVEETFKRLRQT